IYQTSDYRFLNLLFLGDDDRDYADLCKHLGRPELGVDERFAVAGDRQAHNRELLAILGEIFATRTLAEWKEELATARGAWSPTLPPEGIYEDPQRAANGFVGHGEYSDGGLSLPAPPIMFDEEAGHPDSAPDFGEHTAEILAQMGCSADEISRLRAA